MRTCAGLKRCVAEDDGQMVVEMAVVAPVMMAVAVVVLNLMWFLEATSLFDRIVPDTVMALAVSPSGESEDAGQERAIAAALEESMAGLQRVEVAVRTESAWEAVEGAFGFSFAPHLTRYVCTMTYRPWPAGLSVAGVDAGIPLALKHERVFVVDRYRSGVLF